MADVHYWWCLIREILNPGAFRVQARPEDLRHFKGSRSNRKKLFHNTYYHYWYRSAARDVTFSFTFSMTQSDGIITLQLLLHDLVYSIHSFHGSHVSGLDWPSVLTWYGCFCGKCRCSAMAWILEQYPMGIDLKDNCTELKDIFSDSIENFRLNWTMHHNSWARFKLSHNVGKLTSSNLCLKLRPPRVNEWSILHNSVMATSQGSQFTSQSLTHFCHHKSIF